jgi:hypothetical protein
MEESRLLNHSTWAAKGLGMALQPCPELGGVLGQHLQSAGDTKLAGPFAATWGLRRAQGRARLKCKHIAGVTVVPYVAFLITCFLQVEGHWHLSPSRLTKDALRNTRMFHGDPPEHQGGTLRSVSGRSRRQTEAET